MSILQFFIILTVLILILLFIPDIFPRCSCCGKLKFRPLIRIHKAVGISPGYSGSRSVCARCCRKYSISNLKDLDRVKAIRRKLELEQLKRNLGG